MTTQKEKEEKKKHRRYGELVADFANAETSDDACHKLIENTQIAFGYSQQFAKKAKEAFPSLARLTTSMAPEEKKLIKLLAEECECLESLSDFPRLPNFYSLPDYLLDKYDIEMVSWDRKKQTIGLRGEGLLHLQSRLVHRWRKPDV